MVLLTATAFTVRAAPPRMSGSYQSPFAQDSLSLLFPSPVLRVGLADALPAGTLDALEEAVLVVVLVVVIDPATQLPPTQV